MADKAELISEMKQRIAHLPPLPDEPEFTTSEETLIRFLKSRDWKVEEAARMLIDSIEYRRATRPQTLDCSWCHNRPGYHSMRQVGHDEAGRPVLYSSFAQAATHKNSSEDSVAHVSYLIENAKRTMAPGVSTWVFVIDCTGMTLGACNPKLGYSVSNVLANHYPERLGLVVCVNHSPVFHGVWKAMKQFLHPNTAAKLRMARTKAKMSELFSQLFSPELTAWLMEEIALNKQKPLPRPQLEFWNPPPASPRDGGGKAHDPRGCRSYVEKYVEAFPKAASPSSSNGGGGSQLRENDATPNGNPGAGEKATPPEGGPDKATPPVGGATGEEGVVPRVHRPHPNIVDQLTGHALERVRPSSEEELERREAQKVVEDKAPDRESPGEEGDEEDLAYEDLEIPSDLQIPPAAVALGASS
ncbi:uncharacterized protein LOC143300353 [Babylonia areolata]|uniref:uncharacterized protein LOC143300353 n=1 Tax=Babylonia areolata TaxID=304850 RepID=UPI003FD607D1